MALVVSNLRKQRVLESVLDQTLSIRLFSNDVIPDPTSTTASFVDFGADPHVMILADWNIQPDGLTTLAATITWSFAFALGEVYGYYVTNAANELEWAERFSAAVVPFMSVDGASIQIVPRFAVA